MVDRDLFLRKVSDLEQYLGQLAEFRSRLLKNPPEIARTRS